MSLQALWFHCLTDHCLQLPGSEEDGDMARESYNKAVRNRQNFNLQVKSRSQTSGMFQLQFRSANSSTIDSSMPRIAVPAMMSNADSTSEDKSAFYYVKIISSNPTAAVSRRSFQTSSRHSLDSGARESPASFSKNSLWLFSLADEDGAAFEDVKLGTMLGHGSFGYVYRGESLMRERGEGTAIVSSFISPDVSSHNTGEWNGTIAAVKVLQHPEMEDGGSILEALLSTQISHPNVVSVGLLFQQLSHQVS